MDENKTNKTELIKKKYHKDKFIDKKKAVTFKLVFKDSGNNQIVPNENNDRVFQLINKKNPSKVVICNHQFFKEYEDYKQYLLKTLANNDNFQTEQSKVLEEYKKHGGQLEDGEIEEIEEIENDEDDQDFEDEEGDEVNSANYEDEPVKNKIVLDEKAKKALKMTEPMNAKELELSKNIKMKLYDEFGMPLSDYDYAQHFAKPGTKGELVFQATVNQIEQPEPDIDYKREEMTEEQKEVFAALQYEGNEPIYQELEDNFVELACQGEDDLVKPKQQQTNFIFDQKEEKSKENKEMEDLEQNVDKMLNLYEKGEKEQFQGQQQIIDEDLKDFNQKKFESILNEHISDIKSRQQEEKIEIKGVLEDQIIKRKEISKLTYQEDLAIQQLMKEESSDTEEENQEMPVQQEQQEIYLEKVEIEGTLIKDFKNQQPLNFVKSTTENRLEKKNEKQEINEDDKINEQKPFPLTKRDKNLTKEEKQARKEQLKQFKKERREKKQNFKTKLQKASKAMENLQNQQILQGNISHVSIYKV